MTLSDLKPYSKIIVISAIAILILIGLLLALLPRRKAPIPAEDITASQTVPPIANVQIKQAPQFQTDLEKITPNLPYQNDKFEIAYEKYPNIVNVKVFAQTTDEYLKNKAEAENFIKGKGVNDICALNIFWDPPLELIKKINAKDTITTGCPPSPKR